MLFFKKKNKKYEFIKVEEICIYCNLVHPKYIACKGFIEWVLRKPASDQATIDRLIKENTKNIIDKIGESEHWSEEVEYFYKKFNI